MKTIWKDSIYYFSLFLGLAIIQPVNGQQNDTTTKLPHTESLSPFYKQAYIELSKMLNGIIPLSIKRAVFLTEWAYLDGKLDYSGYCNAIDSTAASLKLFIKANHLTGYKAGGNYALFEYFCHPNPMNSNKPFTYDFDDFAGSEDFTKLFVTKLMRTHTGQCRSLPMYYKVLAEAIGTEAFITLVPQHLFIRHRDEQNLSKWVNVELTTQSLSREIFYIENFGISDEVIRNKIYMNPLSDKETVAFLISELLVTGYIRKHRQWDDWVWECTLKSLEYFPLDITAMQHKGNVLNTRLMNHIKENNGVMDDYARALDHEWFENNELLIKLGFTRMSDEMYLQKLKQTFETIKQGGLETSQIENEIKQIESKTSNPK